jgi:hypothetical protein
MPYAHASDLYVSRHSDPGPYGLGYPRGWKTAVLGMAHPQGIEESNMAGPGETLGIPRGHPFPYKPVLILCSFISQFHLRTASPLESGFHHQADIVQEDYY